MKLHFMKKIACLLLAACMGTAAFFVPDTRAFAKAKVEPSSRNITVGVPYELPIRVSYSKGDAQIKNLKTNSKNLIAKQTYQYFHDWGGSDNDNYGTAEIGLYAKKAGTYQVTFDVCSQSGKKNSRHTVKVIARNPGASDYPIKRVTFAGKNTFYEISKKKSGKFKVVLNKGYKLKSITMTYYDKSGKEVTKKIKNNGKVTLSEYASKHENEWTSSYSDEWSYNLSTDMFARTEFAISYQNTKTKATGEIWYSLYRMPKN